MPRKPKKRINWDNPVSAQIKVKRSKTGLGLYAKEHLKKGDFVVEYRGTRLSYEEAEYHPGRYLFEINSRVTINGVGRDNVARYINHSCRPNCEPDVKKGRVLIFAKRRVDIGEELTYDYGREYFNRFLKPAGCKCLSCA
ncbi:MAG: SET domain-containing protein [bacterium]|nr:SET domain-containing protein [bacterium]